MLLNKTTIVRSCVLLRHVSTHLRLNGLTCITQGYTTYLVPHISCTKASQTGFPSRMDRYILIFDLFIFYISC